MIEVIYRCDKCGGTLISHYRREYNNSIKIACSDCGHYEIINLNDYASSYNKMFLEILSVIKDV